MKQDVFFIFNMTIETISYIYISSIYWKGTAFLCQLYQLTVRSVRYLGVMLWQVQRLKGVNLQGGPLPLINGVYNLQMAENK